MIRQHLRNQNSSNDDLIFFSDTCSKELIVVIILNPKYCGTSSKSSSYNNPPSEVSVYMIGSNLARAGAELEKTRLVFAGSRLALEVLDFFALGLSLLLKPPYPHRILSRTNVAVTHTRHIFFLRLPFAQNRNRNFTRFFRPPLLREIESSFMQAKQYTLCFVLGFLCFLMGL